jgi:hypothetical protein
LRKNKSYNWLFQIYWQFFRLYDLMTDYEAPEGSHAPVFIAGGG